MSTQNRSLPLAGIRVLDLSRVLAGPSCTQHLADLGAEVIKVERPITGDDTRGWGPPFFKNAEGEITEAAYYISANRNKKSIEVDISSPTGIELLHRLAKISDIVVENYKVGGLKKYGLDYESIAAINPKVVYCSVTGFGQDGPYAPRPGYDFLIQGFGGLMSVTGEHDKNPGGGPQKAGSPVTDIVTGIYAALGIVAALHESNRSGKGQHLDVSLLDCHNALLAGQNSNYFATGKSPIREGNASTNLVPYQVFAVADGHLIIAVGNDSQFKTYSRIIGRPDLSEDVRFQKNKGRIENREALNAILNPIMLTRSQKEWIQALEPVGVPVGPINTIEQVFNDPHVQHRGAKVDMAHPTAGTVSVTANPIKFSATPVEYTLPPPLLGQHTEEILKNILGYTDQQVADYVATVR